MSSGECVEEYAYPCDEDGVAYEVVDLGSRFVSVDVVCYENHDYAEDV